MFVFSLFTSNISRPITRRNMLAYLCIPSDVNMTWKAQIGQHITPCNIMLHFVTVCAIYYLLLCADVSP